MGGLIEPGNENSEPLKETKNQRTKELKSAGIENSTREIHSPGNFYPFWNSFFVDCYFEHVA